MRQISILNFKGGTGKTSLVTNLAYALTQQNKRVLLVDCDLQANASSLLPEQRDPTLTHVLKGEASFSDAIQSARDNLDILPALPRWPEYHRDDRVDDIQVTLF